MSPLIIVLIVVALIALWIIAVYNALIRLRNRTREAWSDIDVQLKRRYDLIPNLIEAVKGYMKHESGTLEKVVKARAEAMQQHDKAGATLEQKAAAENMLSSTLKSIFALSENYPDLKANQNFLQLQDELSDTENKIQASRRFYNGMARDFNIKIEVFPNNIIAGMLKFSKREFFELQEEAAKEPVKVEF